MRKGQESSYTKYKKAKVHNIVDNEDAVSGVESNKKKNNFQYQFEKIACNISQHFHAASSGKNDDAVRIHGEI